MSPDGPANSARGARLHRSYLYAPGSRPDVMRKAIDAGADAVILDLEDAVAHDAKRDARHRVAEVLASDIAPSHPDLHVRVNRGPDGYEADDLHAVVTPSLAALRLPKCDDVAEVQRVAALLDDLEAAAGISAGAVRLYPTFESAAGALVADAVLRASERIERAAFGAADFVADIGAEGDADLATLHVRSLLVLVSRAAVAGPPIDSVYTRLDDDTGLEAAARRARALGFVGKSVIHPRQLPVVHAVFTPADEELAWARDVVDALATAEASGQGAVARNGEMIDAAVVARARRLLDLGERSAP